MNYTQEKIRNIAIIAHVGGRHAPPERHFPRQPASSGACYGFQ